MRMRMFAFFVVLIQSIICTMAFAEESRYVVNRRVAIVGNKGTIETTTEKKLIIQDKNDARILKDIVFRIDPLRESIEMIQSTIYRRNNSGKWILASDAKKTKSEGLIEQNDRGTYYLDLPRIDSFPALVAYEVKVATLHPVINGQFWSMHTMSEDMPVSEAVYEVSVPKGTGVFYLANGFSGEPEIQSDDNRTRYVWTLRDLPPVSTQSPEDKERSQKSIFVSSTTDWKVIAEYYTEEFEQRIVLFDDLEKTIFRISGSKIKIEGTKREKLEIIKKIAETMKKGPSEDLLLPQQANRTLEKGRGDCKDLAVLMVSMIRSTGIESYVSLTNKDIGDDLERLLPHIYLFNHALVYIPVQEGIDKVILIDPTTPTKILDETTSGLVIKKDHPFFMKGKNRGTDA